MIKNPLTYEIMTPQSVGVPKTRLVLGKHSGRHALGLRCEQLGFRLSLRELDEIYREFIVLADNLKTVEDGLILRLIEDRHKLHMLGAAAQANVARRARDARPMPLPPASEHEREQDDYLWGV
jgi:2-isopropylmalate synthase